VAPAGSRPDGGRSGPPVGGPLPWRRRRRRRTRARGVRRPVRARAELGPGSGHAASPARASAEYGLIHSSRSVSTWLCSVGKSSDQATPFNAPQAAGYAVLPRYTAGPLALSPERGVGSLEAAP